MQTFERDFDGENGRITKVVVKVASAKKWRKSPDSYSHLWSTIRFGKLVIALSVIGIDAPTCQARDGERVARRIDFSQN